MDKNNEQEEMNRPLSDYIGAKEAAYRLNITQNRVYEHIREERLRARKFGKVYHILEEDVANFQPRPTGRKRSKAVPWHTFTGDVQLLITMIDVQIRPGQREALREKLRAIYMDQHHLFPGTMARYVLLDDEATNNLTIWLVWKSTDVPAGKEYDNLLKRFKEDTAQVLDWATANIRVKASDLHT